MKKKLQKPIWMTKYSKTSNLTSPDSLLSWEKGIISEDSSNDNPTSFIFDSSILEFESSQR